MRGCPKSGQIRLAAPLTIGISKVSLAEIDVVVALHAASFTSHWDDPWSRDFLWRILSAPGAIGFIASEPMPNVDLPLGFVLARTIEAECEILSIGVVSDARRHGFGRALLNALYHYTAGLGATSMVLEVAEDNVPAIGLYHGLGFTQVGRRPHYYRRGQEHVDALIFRGETIQP